MTKILWGLFTIAGVWAAVPAVAGTMGADEARRFIVGNVFSFTCFEGTSGQGRVNGDGSVEGVIRLGGSGLPHHAKLPAGTLRARDDAICAAVAGISYETCFELERTGPKSFRGSAPAIGKFAACQFTKR
jgi:hypothetical protein